MLTVKQFLEGFLTKWETSKHSLDKDDSGNYFKGVLVGSKYGVTGAALAKYLGSNTVALKDVRDITLLTATNIARDTYYDEAQFDLLPWGPVVASAVDKCYMSGEDAAIRCLQRAAGVLDDGHVGPKTVVGVATAATDQAAFAVRFASEREKHEALVIKAKPVKAKYRAGWNNRSKSYLPGTDWWKSWQIDEPKVDTYAAARPARLLDAPGEVADTAKTVTETPDAITTVIVEPNTTGTAVKQALSGWQGNLVGGVGIVLALLLDPTFSALLGRFTTALATGHGRYGALLALVSAGLVVYRHRPAPG